MWEADTMMHVRMPKFAKISLVFNFIYKKHAGVWGSTTDLIVAAVCLYI